MLESHLLNQAAVFVLILGRVGALVSTAPLLGDRSAPVRVKALLAAALSVLILPTHAATPLSSTPGGELQLGGFAGMLATEVLVGLLLGLGMTVLLTGAQVAGQVVAQVSGLSLGDVFNPALDDSVSIFGQLFYFVTLAVFACIGGHRLLMDALLDTFAWAPPGHAVFDASFVEVMVGLLSQSFELGLRAAAPLLIALFLSTVVLGLISRTLPQINTVAVGFSVNSLLALSVMMLTLGALAWTFQAPIDEAVRSLATAARGGAL